MTHFSPSSLLESGSKQPELVENLGKMAFKSFRRTPLAGKQTGLVEQTKRNARHVDIPDFYPPEGKWGQIKLLLHLGQNYR
jgi:hypothetical protein